MKQQKLLFILFFGLIMPEVYSQGWVKHGAGISSADVCVIDIAVPGDNIAWGILSVFASGTCGGVVPYYVRTVNGNNWSPGPIALLPDVTPVCITAISSTTAWIAAANIASNTLGYIYKTTNSGGAWVLQSTANFTDAIRFIHFFDANDGVAVGDSSIFITHDGGTNWIANGALPVPSATIGSGSTIFLLNSYEVVGNNIWLGDTYGYFYKSTDKGLTWNLLPGNIYPSAVKGIAFRDSLYGMAVAAQYISGGSGGPGGYADYSVFTTDGGNTWQPMTFNFVSSTVVNSTAKYDVAYIPGTANTFIATSEYDPSYAAFSAITYDGGVNWQMMDSTEQHTACVFTSPTNGFTGGYISNFQSGIYRWSGPLVLGVNEMADANSLQLFPNPAVDKISFTYDGKSGDDAQVVINDVTGKIIYSEKIADFNNRDFTVDVKDFKEGFYLLQLKTSNGVINSQKFIKSKN
ncbi:MAG: T9SS type A sorting domain-containing protein [Bacteroidota bacterium]